MCSRGVPVLYRVCVRHLLQRKNYRTVAFVSRGTSHTRWLNVTLIVSALGENHTRKRDYSVKFKADWGVFKSQEQDSVYGNLSCQK